MSLPGPSRTITVEPVELPDEALPPAGPSELPPGPEPERATPPPGSPEPVPA